MMVMITPSFYKAFASSSPSCLDSDSVEVDIQLCFHHFESLSEGLLAVSCPSLAILENRSLSHI